jgi:glycosyltransferase involved in cell wall biosynthesis
MEEVAGTTARFVDVGDHEGLASELLESMNLNTEQRAQISLAARERAEGFTWGASLRQHLVAYNLAQSGV